MKRPVSSAVYWRGGLVGLSFSPASRTRTRTSTFSIGSASCWLTPTSFGRYAASLPSSVLNLRVHMKKIRSRKVTSIIGVISSSHFSSLSS